MLKGRITKCLLAFMMAMSFVSVNAEESESEEIAVDCYSCEDDDRDLFASYVDHLLGEKMFSEEEEVELATGTTAFSKLTLNEKNFYNQLLFKITQVAQGKVSSTRFTFGMSVFTDTDVFKVIDAVMYDHPYECYWIDKTAGWYYMTRTPDKNKFVFGVAVSKDFATSTKTAVKLNSGTKYYHLNVNTSRISSVNSSISYAKSLVARFKDLSDYEKLKKYAEVICDLTDYNYPAADADTNTPYGDPWQLIHVFDGNPETKVVCEGYAKAFQYLCDLTSFEAGTGIKAISVSGNVYTDGSGGRHMYNIVRMENGKNYLVDVTHSDCDDGFNPEAIFMRGGYGNVSSGYTLYDEYGSTKLYTFDADPTQQVFRTTDLTLSTEDYVPCEHVWDEGKITITKKCNVAGVKTYTCLNNCGGHKNISLGTIPHNYNIYNRCSACGGYAPGISASVPAIRIKSVSKGKASMKVKWSKNSKVKGYQIRYSTSPSMASSKLVTITKYKTTSKTIKKLKKKTKYYVQMRTYKDINGKRTYSVWSAQKNVTTK